MAHQPMRRPRVPFNQNEAAELQHGGALKFLRASRILPQKQLEILTRRQSDPWLHKPSWQDPALADRSGPFVRTLSCKFLTSANY